MASYRGALCLSIAALAGTTGSEAAVFLRPGIRSIGVNPARAAAGAPAARNIMPGARTFNTAPPPASMGMGSYKNRSQPSGDFSLSAQERGRAADGATAARASSASGGSGSCLSRHSPGELEAPARAESKPRGQVEMKKNGEQEPVDLAASRHVSPACMPPSGGEASLSSAKMSSSSRRRSSSQGGGAGRTPSEAPTPAGRRGSLFAGAGSLSTGSGLLLGANKNEKPPKATSASLAAAISEKMPKTAGEALGRVNDAVDCLPGVGTVKRNLFSDEASESWHRAAAASLDPNSAGALGKSGGMAVGALEHSLANDVCTAANWALSRGEGQVEADAIWRKRVTEG